MYEKLRYPLAVPSSMLAAPPYHVQSWWRARWCMGSAQRIQWRLHLHLLRRWGLNPQRSLLIGMSSTALDAPEVVVKSPVQCNRHATFLRKLHDICYAEKRFRRLTMPLSKNGPSPRHRCTWRRSSGISAILKICVHCCIVTFALSRRFLAKPTTETSTNRLKGRVVLSL